MDLSDEQIEKLLQEAEQRLASGGSQKAVLTAKPKTATALLTAATATATITASAVEGQKGDAASAKKKSQDLSLRVPVPVVKKDKTTKADAGPLWYNMPRTKIEDPKVKRDLQILKMRSVLDPKQHFRKDTRKSFPAFSQPGVLIDGPTDTARLTRKERKSTIAEEVLASSGANSKFKARYNEIQERKMSGKKAHYKKVMARRKGRP